jgi:hypothetical protein
LGRSNPIIIPKWINRISFLYLLIPLLIFCLGNLKIFVSIPIFLIFVWLIIKIWKAKETPCHPYQLSWRGFVFTIVAVMAWVALSGIGGFAFQNTDFHIRNAIFRDLISFDWPVKYFTNPVNPSIPYSLVYYTGFWLPAALVGKIAGWLGANITLYIWTVLGILLTLFLLASRIKLTPGKIVLILIFFSGMDSLGILLKLIALPNTFNSLWPPIYHLEWWMPGMQYSSFSTQLFWVFNQAVPVWLCMALLFVSGEQKVILLIWSICCFYAPLPAIGMFPYLVIKIPKEIINLENLGSTAKVRNFRDFWVRSLKDAKSVLSFENVLGGGITLGISLSYFLSNPQASQGSIFQMQGVRWLLYAIFVLFEGLILWWVFRDRNKANLSWYMAGLLLLAVPLIHIGSANDFCMRASIPTLFMLFIWTAETLSIPTIKVKGGLLLLLCIGAVTPIYEINRSIFRTATYYLWPPTSAEKYAGQQVSIYTPTTFEFDHPYTLTADSYKSLENYDPRQIANFLAESNTSFFETYLSK